MNFLWMLPSAVMAIWWAATTGSWQFALMSLSSLLVSVLIQVIRGRDRDQDKLAQYPTSWDGSRWHIGTRTIARSPRLWRPAERRRVHAEIMAIATMNSAEQALAARRESGFQAETAGPLGLWLGRSAGGLDLELSLARDGPHCILVGPTGAGKSRLLSLMAVSLANSARAEWLLFDFKGGATLEPVSAYLSARGDTYRLATDLSADLATDLCGELTRSLEARERLLAEAGVADYQAFNGANLRRRKLPPILVLVDEFAALLRTIPIAQATFEAVATRGRSLGVHLVVTSQTCSGIPRTVLSNLRQRVVFAGVDPVDAVQLGFGSTPTLGTCRSGWAAAAKYDSATRESIAFSFPLELGEHLAGTHVFQSVGNRDGLTDHESGMGIDA